jgi:hypothetical protein
MDACWFVLKQSHYPPPTLPASPGIGNSKGAICLGHIVPSLKSLDVQLNGDERGFEYTAAAPVYATKAWDLEWDKKKSTDIKTSGEGGGPIGAATGITAQASAALAFQKSVENYRIFHKLDRYIFEPTRAYITKALDHKEVTDHLSRHTQFGSWSLYMITGIAVARGSRGGFSESKSTSVNTGANM